MNPEQKTFATLSNGAAGSRVFPEHLPEKMLLPCIVYSRQGGRMNRTVCAGGNDYEYRITIYAKTAEQRTELMDFVIGRMEADYEQQAAPFLAFDYNLKAHTAVLIYSLPE